MFRRLLQYDVLKDTTFYERDNYENILQDPNSKMGRTLSRLIIGCIIIWVLIVIFETVPELFEKYSLGFFMGDLIISTIFLLEYLYRFWRSWDKFKFLWWFFNIIDLVSFAPFFLALLFPSLMALNILKVLRLLRILRLFEVSVKSPIALWFIKTIREYHKEYKAIFTLFVSLLVIISSFVYLAESSSNPLFLSIPDALWWGLVTMTTVGYGDMIPITITGKFLWVVLILLGPVLLAVISSITILVFMDVAESQKITDTKICQTCKTRNSEHANFCFNCGEQHFVDNHLLDIPQEETTLERIPLLGKLFSKK